MVTVLPPPSLASLGPWAASTPGVPGGAQSLASPSNFDSNVTFPVWPSQTTLLPSADPIPYTPSVLPVSPELSVTIRNEVSLCLLV